jgi:hypothetical protein
MDTWQNIPPCHTIFYPMCQIIFPKYFIDVDRLFQKKFIHVHLLMVTFSPLTLTHSRNSIFGMKKVNANVEKLWETLLGALLLVHIQKFFKGRPF